VPLSNDESKSEVLPETELNPLLNPVLGENMGRWAEVYFTSPPERRAEAVSDLVRELRANSASGYPSSASVQDTPPQAFGSPAIKRRTDQDRDLFAGIEELSVVCESCGHRNLAGQRFCGMCGVPLSNWPREDSQPAAEEPLLSGGVWQPLAEQSPEAFSEGEGAERSAERTAVPYLADTDAQSAQERATEERDDRYRPQHDPLPSLEQIRAPFEGLSDYGSERPGRYRIYIGLALAIILGLLVYSAWRNNTTFWSSGTAPSSLPQAVPSPAESGPPAPSPAPSTAKTATPPATPPRNANRPVAGSSQTSAQTNRAGTPRQEVGRKISDRQDKVGSARELSNVAKPAITATPATGQSGAEELAVAQRYLNAGPGSSRDSREGANWLWKAVGKQNLTATLLLSDLYLRGDGVTKSCDQARLLLDAAARKGATAAAERLRNLPAFGCQ
jgi:TPR repeat protein